MKPEAVFELPRRKHGKWSDTICVSAAYCFISTVGRSAAAPPHALFADCKIFRRHLRSFSCIPWLQLPRCRHSSCTSSRALLTLSLGRTFRLDAIATALQYSESKCHHKGQSCRSEARAAACTLPAGWVPGGWSCPEWGASLDAGSDPAAPAAAPAAEAGGTTTAQAAGPPRSGGTLQRPTAARTSVPTEGTACDRCRSSSSSSSRSRSSSSSSSTAGTATATATRTRTGSPRRSLTACSAWLVLPPPPQPPLTAFSAHSPAIPSLTISEHARVHISELGFGGCGQGATAGLLSF